MSSIEIKKKKEDLKENKALKDKIDWLSKFGITMHPKENVFRIHLKHKQFSILQITDMHLHHALPFSSEHEDLEFVANLVKKYKPNIIVNTGDLFCFNAQFLVRRIIKKFDKIVGSLVPWAFAWGNHDNENFRPNNLEKLDRLDDFIEQQPHSLYFANRDFIKNINPEPPKPGSWEYLATIAPLKGEYNKTIGNYNGTYSGNYAIEIILDNTDKKESQVVAILFILNSRRSYHVPENALKWLKEYINSFKKDGKDVPPSFLFFHVPNNDFNDIWDSGKAIGFKLENVCHGFDEGQFHKFLKTIQNVKACFVGHDHVNDYYGIKDGIVYAYGRKTCRSGYGVQRDLENKNWDKEKRKVVDGGKLITLDFEKRKWGFKSVLWGDLEVFPFSADL